MALSPNYSWSEPDNSSLVKNGAADIRTLGDAIDTSLWNVGFGQAGKNKIINGDFTINQRGFTSTTTSGTFGFDRFNLTTGGDGTTTYSAQTFTIGAAPVAGYEATNFAQLVTTGQTSTAVLSCLSQKVESVRTFAGQTITVSFWAKASSGTPNITAFAFQNFGSGGSTGVFTGSTKQAISTSWARYSFVIAVPSISGKTIGTGDHLRLDVCVSAGSDRNAYTNSLGIQTGTFQIWGVQAEYGSKATPFQTASGSIAGELALAQRYYYRNTIPVVTSPFGSGFADTTLTGQIFVPFPQEMRTNPTALEQSGTAADYQIRRQGAATIACNSVPTFAGASKNGAQVAFVVASGLTAGESLIGRSASVTTAYLGWSAEL